MFETPMRSLMTFTNVIIALFLAALFFHSNGAINYQWTPLEGDYSEQELFALLNPEDPSLEKNETDATPAVPSGPATNYVLWLNISGMRTDYIDKATTPFFDDAISQGYTTKRFEPVTPTLRWPNLVSQATGAGVSKHGILSDVMRHPGSGEIMRFPTDLSLLKAEAIWTTAKRQGIGVLVHDWPFSQTQPDENAADIYLAEFDPEVSDSDRLATLLEAWEGFEGTEGNQLRLIMASLDGIDQAARKLGCRNDQMYAAVTESDQVLGDFFDQIKEKWSTLANPQDHLFVFLTTDHGMMDVNKLINLGELIDPSMRNYVEIATSDTVGHLWMKNLPPEVEEATAVAKIEEALGDRIYWTVYKKADVPPEWDLGSGPTIGDWVIQLKSGYAFTEASGPEEVFAPSEIGEQFAASGLSTSQMSRMRGQAIVFRVGANVGQEWETVQANQIHPTVCKLLDISPGPDATGEALEIAVD